MSSSSSGGLPRANKKRTRAALEASAHLDDEEEVGEVVRHCDLMVEEVEAAPFLPAPLPTRLTVTVTGPGSVMIADPLTIYVINNAGDQVYQPANGVTINVAPDTYTIRVYKDWHIPSPAVTPNIVVAPHATVPHAVQLEPLYFHLHVDADRDGAIDDDRTGLDVWQYGAAAGRKGAIMLCNCDDDSAGGAVDHADQVVNGNNDHTEVAPIEIRRAGANANPPARWFADLSILHGRSNQVRIFADRLAGANEILGPTSGDHYDFPDLNFPARTLAIEATEYATTAWDGLVTVQLGVYARAPNAALTAFDGPVLSYHEGACFRVAPWMIASHLVNAERLYATDQGGANAAFLQDMYNAATDAGILLDTSFHGILADKWMQDCMEFGQHRSPHAGFRVVNQGPRQRGLDRFPVTLLGQDMGYVRPSNPGGGATTTFDSTGNLEVTPPVTGHDGVTYPHGRIYYCPGRGFTTMDATFPRVPRRASCSGASSRRHLVLRCRPRRRVDHIRARGRSFVAGLQAANRQPGARLCASRRRERRWAWRLGGARRQPPRPHRCG